MKKKLSFLLALVFIFTLAFSVIPGAGATWNPPPPPPVDVDYGTLTVTKSQAADSAVIAADQVFTVYLYFQSNNDEIIVDTAASSGVATKLDTPVSFPDDNFSGSYQWQLDLNVGESVKFINVNENSDDDNYFKAYEPSPGANWSVTYSKDNGDGHVNDTENESIVVTNKFTPPFGTVTITKDVVTKYAPATGVKFPVSVKFTLPEGSDDALYLDIMKNGSSVDASANGAYLFQLADGDSITFSNLPVGTTYLVDEIMAGTPEEAAGWALDGVVYRQDSRETSKKIDCAGDNDAVTVNNKYIKGMLEITKYVTGNAPAGQEFPVTVTFMNKNGLGTIIPPLGAVAVADQPGVYTLMLKKDMPVVFYGIPTGTFYTVGEDLTAAQIASGWVLDDYDSESIYEGDAAGQIVSAGAHDSVGICNKYTKGMLTVTKIIPDTAPTGIPFPVTVTFTLPGNAVNTITNSGTAITPVKDGNKYTYTFEILAGTPVVFYGIPVHTTYSVSESLTENHGKAGWYTERNYVDYSDRQCNYIDECGDSDTADVINKYCPPDTGYIIINKVINTKDEAADFFVTVKFKNANPYMDLSKIEAPAGATFNSTTGEYTVKFTTSGSMSVKFDKIPVGTVYEVKEPEATIPQFWSFVSIDNTDKTEPLNTIEIKGDDDVITITNKFTMPTGTLIVDKDVTANSPVNVPFTFTVVFSGYNLKNIEASYQQQEQINSAPQQIISTTPPEPETRSFTFTLTGEQTPVQFTNIPLGTNYLITESKDLPANWAYVSGDGEGSFNRENLEDTATFLNNYTPPVTIEYATLTIDKTVSGTGALGNVPFAMTVTFTANPWNISGIGNSLGQPVSASGVYTFTLTADAPVVTFTNIPVGTKYTVSEAIDPVAQAGWTEGASTGKGGPDVQITAAGATAEIKNVYSAGVLSENDTGNAAGSEQGVAGATDLPQTGGIASSTLLGLLGLVLIAIGGTAFTMLRKKNTGKSR